ncbi:unnamed protein product [Striga asiatica]|uniref:Uncharacterized protein n=1 Tax=Striga asiatica TaxID=4170 RepID=A0A5A7Q0E4_STRAF|nr:unnamed protein product [Striga asiatica]
MDVWIIAAAAGAGYVAKRFKKLNMGKCTNISDSSSENLEIATKSLETVNRVQDNIAEDISKPIERAFPCASAVEMAPTSGYQTENFIISDSNSLPGPSNNGDFAANQEVWLHSVMNEDISGKSSEVGFSYDFRRNRSSLRSRHVNNRCIKHRTSLESCLMAQLCNEHAKMEEYTYSTYMPCEPMLRPFIVTDGNRIISRAFNESCSKELEAGNYKLGKDNNPNCDPRLQNDVQVELLVRDKGKPVKTVKKQQGNAQGSSSDGALLFYLGLTMGITYSSLQQKREIEKLRNSLKQTEDLVEDLQEELEMKDASTLKELTVEDHESLDVRNYSYFNDPMQSASPEQKLDCSPNNFNEDYRDRDSEEESLRKIEAELEAELDRLASNMKSCSLEGKLLNAAEVSLFILLLMLVLCVYTHRKLQQLDSDLRPELFGANAAQNSTSGCSSPTATTPHSVHYPVSPRDLSLRLHQVIQSRLEERVKELETALEQSQKIINRQSKNNNPCESESSFSSAEILRHLDQPVVINLSGEALSAYNEAYDELAKLSESDNASLDNYAELSNDGSEDEMERLLIRQIVEKARQGSPAVLKAQRDLFCG